MSRIVKQEYDGVWIKQEYDDNGNEIYREYSNGYWAKHEYDDRGNVTYCESSNGSWAKWEYDNLGNVTYYENSDGDKHGTPKAKPKMADLVDRNKVLEIIFNIMSDDQIVHKHRALNRNIKQIPKADTEEHGYWEEVQEEELYCPDAKTTITKTTQTCSCCKIRIGFIGPKQYLFDDHCPNCGCKMNKNNV